MTDDRVIKSYVWHEEKCFFVSTIERDSSAMYGPRRFNETLVWEYDWKTTERGKIVMQESGPAGSIQAHLWVCKKLYETGLKEPALE